MEVLVFWVRRQKCGKKEFKKSFLFYSPGAYKYADGRKIDGKRVLVDVERGRTVKGKLK